MSWRKGIAKHSKFRNVYGEPYRKDKCYENVKFSKNGWDGTYCSVNPKFLAVVLDTSGAGGAFLVIPIEKVGHQKVDSPRVAGHQREILDIQWNPFNDHIIASASEDTTIKIWRIPSGGLTEDLVEPLVDLQGHQRKVGFIRWHPTANGIIASAAFDFKIIVWNALKAKALHTIDGHHDTIFDLAFNYDGSIMATTSKDKKIRVINAHTGKITQTFGGHSSPKTSHLSFTDKTSDHIITTGFTTSGERQISLWDLNNTSSAVATVGVDNSSSILMLHYDIDLHIAYAAGKGDGLIMYVEVREEEPFLMKLSDYRNATPQKSLGKICKRGLDPSRCEIFRFYKLHPNNWIEPIPMLCPRRSDEFQEDLYPPTSCMVPALTAEEWASGMDKDPILMSLKDGASQNTTAMSPTSATSSAAKYNSMFNKPAKFEKQLSKDAILSNDVNHDVETTLSSSFVSKTTIQEVQSVNDEEHQKVQKLCDDQVREIEVLKRTISTKDQRILKLEQEMASKNDELSEMREQFSKKVSELREANSRLASRAQSGLSTTDGRTVRAETTFTKTSQTAVQSVPERPTKQLVQESITSTKFSHSPMVEREINKALEDIHQEPVRTTPTYGRQTSGSYTPESQTPRRQIPESQTARSQIPESQTARSQGQTLGNQTLGAGSKTPVSPTTGTKTHGSSSDEYRIEDIEAELEALREDLARTREISHGAKSSVRYVSEDYNPRQTSEGHTRSAYLQGASATSDVSSPRSHGYGGSSFGTSSISGNLDSGLGNGVSQKRPEPDEKRMIITTASYARVPKLETGEASFARQSSTKDKKVSKLIEKFNSQVSVDPSRNHHRRRNSGEVLGRLPRNQRSRKERPKSAINFEHWEKYMKSNNLK